MLYFDNDSSNISVGKFRKGVGRRSWMIMGVRVLLVVGPLMEKA